MKNKVFKHCKIEMANNPDLYLDSFNCVDFTLLANEFIDNNIDNNIDLDDFELIYEYVIDFFVLRKDLREKYNF